MVLQKYLPLILFTVLTNAAAQIMLKYGMTSIGQFEFGARTIATTAGRVAVNPLIILGLFTFAISMSSHMLVLSRVELTFAYPFLSLAYVVVAVWGFFIFGESMSLSRVLGIALICAGTFFIARS
ncbi:MAG: EamA family transporter [Azospirillaceae bacterium]